MEFDTDGYFLVLFSFTCNLMWGCVTKSLGVLLPTLTDQFTTHTWVIGIIASVLTITSYLGGLLTMPLDERFSCRRLLIVTSAVESIGLLLFPLARSTIHVALAFAVLVGPNVGIIMVFNRVVLGRHFRERFTLACGIGHAGQAVALLAFAPMTQLFLDTYGWRGAALLLAGISMHQIASAAVVRVTKAQYEPLTDSSDNHQDDIDKEGCRSRGKKSILHLVKAVDLGILLEFKFWIVFMGRFGVSFTFNAWVLYYVPHLEAKGFPPQVAAALCSAAAVGYFLGSIMWAPLIDRGIMKCSTAIIISSLFLSLSFVVDPWVNDIASYAVATFICGLFTAALYTLQDVLTRDMFEMDRLVSAFVWGRVLLFAPGILAGFLPGWIYEARGSYDLAFIVIGLVPTLCLLPLIIGLLRKTTNGL
ncbi:monocarboxylate transporter 12-like [Patiria miniata]|uniref:Major facilitator superfamily (MFS) profile domain-containing protein n=1 Tax=Patiria miniata TaxID=46514 RepID=A0A914BML8_PATMI|nr:monocarboxylate transporter 12-like [Patiria miniata]